MFTIFIEEYPFILVIIYKAILIYLKIGAL